ncbi:MAG: phage baseplate assembly protein V [Nostoc desertorum CM1-VF14]|jgi:hypothetical protein|nr:phage baseplate assembly protein V [Nostoc desertorum CM1-VF14]
MGWIPGIITSLEDPEGLGRIQAKWNLIDSNPNLQNSDDTLVTVGDILKLIQKQIARIRYEQQLTIIKIMYE